VETKWDTFLVEVRCVFRWVVIAAVFLPVLSAQATSAQPSPIALSGTIESLDGVQKLVESVQNTSIRRDSGLCICDDVH
jgi:hypothetical protein